MEDSNKKKSIAFLIPSLQQGGLENAVTVISNSLSERNIKVYIICAYNKEIFYNLNSNVIILCPSYERSNYSSFLYYYKTFVFFKRKIKTISPDVILSYGDYLNPISILSNISIGLPIFISDRSSPDKVFPLAINILRKILYSRSSGIIAQTNRARIQKVNMLPGYDKIEVIPNPIRSIKNYPDLQKENIILAIGRHYPVKGLDRLLKSYSNVKVSDWKLVIAGSFGPQTSELQKLARDLGIEDQVEFLGAVKEIDEIFAKSKIFVLTSRSEGFPNALIEAMAHGLPCISFDIVAGPAEIIKNNINGILIADNDIKSMSQSIKELMLNDELRKSLGKEALKIKNELSIDTITDKFVDFIKINK